MATTPKGAPYPVLSDPNDGPGAFAALAGWVDSHPGVSALTTAARAALAGAAAWTGRLVAETDTGRLMLRTAAGWRRVAVEETVDGSWQDFTPSISVTTLDAGFMRWRLLGKTVTVRGAFWTSGAPPATITVSLPVPAAPPVWTGPLGKGSNTIVGMAQVVPLGGGTVALSTVGVAGSQAVVSITGSPGSVALVNYSLEYETA